MKQYTITLTLQEDVIISQRSASVGGHRSLDYIPGAVLLGACAGRLYGKLAEEQGLEQAYKLFHSGKVRFGNAFPLSLSGQPGMPMPFVWSYEKGENKNEGYQIKREGGRYQLDADKVKQIDPDNNDGKQYVQLRSGYLTEDLEILKPIQTLRMKTAIEPDTAKAAVSQLFGYQALQAGQQFRAVLSADDDVCELAEQAVEVMRGTLLLGRSRSAQYGKVECRIGEAQDSPKFDDQLKNMSILSLWLQADMVLQDKTGRPFMVLQDETGRPLMHGDEVGLPGLPDSTIDWKKSHLRFRRYSPYNGKRRSFDMERQAIEKGSVLVVKTKPLDQAGWEVLQAGLGLYRESGLGQVLVNHPLTGKIDNADAFKDIAAAETIQIPKRPDSDLAKWIQSSVSLNKDVHRDKAKAELLIDELPKLYQNARSYYGLDAQAPIGPSPSQWSQAVEIAKLQPDQTTLFSGLFDKDKGICRVKGKDNDAEIKSTGKADDWQAITFDERGLQTTFAGWLKHGLEDVEIKNHAYVASLVARMAAETVKAQNKGGRDDA